MWWTVWLLVGLVVGGGVWWRWSWERWRRALVAEQVGRAQDRFVAGVELGRWQEWGAQAQGALEAQRAALLAEGLAVDVRLWESELGDGR